MRVLVTGATGTLGARLCAALTDAGHEVAALSRDGAAARRRLPLLADAYDWQPLSGPPPPAALDGADAVVNLMGERVAGRWTRRKRRAVYDSRVLGTRNLVAGVRAAADPPRVLVSASAMGYYGDRGEDILTEREPSGGDFLAEVCRDWEAEALRAQDAGVRTAALRFATILSPTGGILGVTRPVYRLGLGGRLGAGRQWWSWIHLDDAAALILWALEADISGAVNAASPNPVRQADFSAALARVLRRPAPWRVPGAALRLLLGGFAVEGLASRRLTPEAALVRRLPLPPPRPRARPPRPARPAPRLKRLDYRERTLSPSPCPSSRASTPSSRAPTPPFPRPIPSFPRPLTVIPRPLTAIPAPHTVIPAPPHHPAPPHRHPAPPHRHSRAPHRHSRPPYRHPAPPHRHPAPPHRHPAPPHRHSRPPYRHSRESGNLASIRAARIRAPC